MPTPLAAGVHAAGHPERLHFGRGATASIAGGQTFRDTVMLAAAAIRQHPDVEAAIDFAYRLTYASCAHRVIHGEHRESSRPLPWEQLIDQLRIAVIAYLLSDPQAP